MATELEFKLAVPNAMLLEKILFDETLSQVRQGGYTMLEMGSVYYDTPDRSLRARGWTLRLRQENERVVATLKTPGPGRARMEYETEAGSIVKALPLLVQQGAPEELTVLGEKGLDMVCGARFTRRAANLAFADGTVCELAGDVGELLGGASMEQLCEVELEYKQGEVETVEAFASELMDRFGLQEEFRSKYARAYALAKEDAR